MKIVFRVHVHTPDEILMGHKLGFSGINGVDAVSATANVDGFTPLNAAARAYGWDRKLIAAASAQCNDRMEVAVVQQVTPTLLLVPQMIKRAHYKRTAEGYAIDLMMAAKHLKMKRLHFTHFGFLQSRKATQGFTKILEVLLNPLVQTPLEELIWEIDFRGLRELKAAHYAVRTRFHLSDHDPQIVLAPQFEWGEQIPAQNGHYWRELVPSTNHRPPSVH